MANANDFIENGQWKCTMCGACCRIGMWSPIILKRVGLEGFVGSDGWCKHYDKGTNECRIYETRPDVCRAIWAKEMPKSQAAMCALIHNEVYGG